MTKINKKNCGSIFVLSIQFCSNPLQVRNLAQITQILHIIFIKMLILYKEKYQTNHLKIRLFNQEDKFVYGEIIQISFIKIEFHFFILSIDFSFTN